MSLDRRSFLSFLGLGAAAAAVPAVAEAGCPFEPSKPKLAKPKLDMGVDPAEPAPSKPVLCIVGVPDGTNVGVFDATSGGGHIVENVHGGQAEIPLDGPPFTPLGEEREVVVRCRKKAFRSFQWPTRVRGKQTLAVTMIEDPIYDAKTMSQYEEDMRVARSRRAQAGSLSEKQREAASEILKALAEGPRLSDEAIGAINDFTRFRMTHG